MLAGPPHQSLRVQRNPCSIIPRQVNNLNLLYQRAQLCHDSEVDWIFEGVVVPVFKAVELDDECMSDTLLLLLSAILIAVGHGQQKRGDTADRE